MGKNLALFAIILFGFILRASFLDKGAIWYDEIGTIAVAKQDFPFGILDKLYYDDYHAPLYYFLLHFWMKLFGDGEVVLRLFSAIIGTLVLPVMYLAGKELKDHKTGLLAAFLASINSLLLFYSQEIRYYELSALWVSLSLLFLTRVYKSPEIKNYAGLVIANLCLAYTMNVLGLAFIFFEALLFFIFTKERKKFFVSQVVFLILFLPFVPFVIHHVFTGVNGFINPFWWNRFDTMDVIISINNFFSYSFVYTQLDKFNPDFIIGMLIYGFFPFLFYFTILIWALINRNKLVILIFLTGIAFYLFIITMAYLDKFTLVPRYTIFICPVVSLVAAYGFFQSKTKHLLLLLIIFASVTIYNLLFTNFSAIKKLRINNLLPETYNFTQNDLIVMDVGARYYADYYRDKQVTILEEFDLEKTISYNDTKKMKLIFDEELIKGLNKNNAHEKFKNFLLSEEISTNFENYVKSSIINKIDGNDRLFVIVSFTLPERKNLANLRSKVNDEKKYAKENLMPFIANKIMYDLLQISEKHLERVGRHNEKHYGIYIYKNKK